MLEGKAQPCTLLSLSPKPAMLKGHHKTTELFEPLRDTYKRNLGSAFSLLHAGL